MNDEYQMRQFFQKECSPNLGRISHCYITDIKPELKRKLTITLKPSLDPYWGSRCYAKISITKTAS